MSKITKEDFYKILDYLDIKPEDTYGNVKLFEKELEEKGKVFRTYAGDTDVNVVQIEDINIVIDTLKFTIPALRDSILNKTDIKLANCKVYDKMVGGYVDVKLLVNNICKAFGVTLDDNIEYVNPDLYNGILRKVLGFYNNIEDLTKMPFGCEKKGDDYKTYYPAWTLFEIATYLNEEGVFNIDSDYPNITPIVPLAVNLEDKTTLINKDEFIAFFNKYYAVNNGKGVADSDSEVEDLKNKLTLLLNTYDVDFNKNIFLYITKASSAGTIRYTLTLYEMQRDITLFNYMTNVCHWTGRVNATVPVVGKPLSNSSYNRYLITYDNITSKNVTATNTSVTFNISNGLTRPALLTNFKVDKRFITYNGASDKYDLSLGAYLQPNTTYTNLQYIDSEDFRDKLYYGRMVIDEQYNDFNITKNDLVLAFTHDNLVNNSQYTLTDSYKIYIIRDADSVAQNITGVIATNNSISNIANRNIVFNGGLGTTWAERGIFEPNTSFLPSIASVENSTKKIIYDFGTSKTIDIYEYNNNSYTHNQIETDKLDMTEEFYYNIVTQSGWNWHQTSNIGKVDVIKEILGVTLEPDADYPINITSYDDFVNHYRDWYADVEAMRGLTYDKESKELIGTTDAWWLPLAMSNVTTQAEAQDALITDSNVEGIITDIEEGDDPDRPDAPSDPDSPPTTDPEQTDIGDTPDIDHAPLQAINGTGIRQYVLTAKQLQDFLREINTPNLIDLAVGAVFGPPKNYIISLVESKVYSASANSYAMTVGPYNFETQAPLNILNYNRVNCGQIDINPYFNNYNDYDSTTVELFLPYVGFVDLNIKDFIGGKIKLWATCDTLSGVICYYVYSIRNGATQIKATFSGNFLAQIPLASYDYSQIASSLINVGAKLI